MSTYRRLTSVYQSSLEVPFDEASKFIIFSDCHRGDNSWTDDFAKNRNLYMRALTYYYEKGYTYIEAGDGDELWKCRCFQDIRRAHSDVFKLLKQYHEQGRLYMIWGNHDLEKRSSHFISQNMYRYYSYRTHTHTSLFEGLKVHEGIRLTHRGAGKSILVVHGHQGDLLNDRLWWLGRFLVRYIWRTLELFGFRNPSSPAKNYSRKGAIETQITHWVKANKQMVIAGHTHRPMFPAPGQPPYFNAGSCVYPSCITGIEIHNGFMALVKWSVKTRSDGTLYVARDILAGPSSIDSFITH